ncbi:unnamed protein product [Tetraodon nigroviridis]|uniref:(spotted green pufferfish) hypothetical protein n=1 Tax=Tetraodon nigroviridis TaxID=99883 RepID=Q4SHV8_TETNG|nr:unnamed protein product [Tetraodon nigroviridis]
MQCEGRCFLASFIRFLWSEVLMNVAHIRATSEITPAFSANKNSSGGVGQLRRMCDLALKCTAAFPRNLECKEEKEHKLFD